MFDKKAFSKMIKDSIGNTSMTKFAEKAGLSTAYISRLVNQKQSGAPSPSVLKKIANVSEFYSYDEFMVVAGYIDPLEVSNKDAAKRRYIISKFDAFEYDGGKKLEKAKSILTSEELEELDEFYAQSSDKEIEEFIRSGNEKIMIDMIKKYDYKVIPISYRRHKLSKKENKVFRNIPVIGAVANLDKIDAEDNIIEYIEELESNLPYGDLLYIKLFEDNMAPTIPKGANVLLRRQGQVKNDEIAAVIIKEEEDISLKRIRYEEDNNITILINDKKDHDIQFITNPDDIKIIGKAIKYSKDL